MGAPVVEAGRVRYGVGPEMEWQFAIGKETSGNVGDGLVESLHRPVDEGGERRGGGHAYAHFSEGGDKSTTG